MKLTSQRLVRNALKAMIEQDMERRTPTCTGWLYQPKRPEQMQKEENVLCKKTENPSANL